MFGPIGRKKWDAKYWKRQKILLKRRRRGEREDIFEEKAGWHSFLGINSCFYMKWLVFHGTPSFISILDNMPWTSQYFSQVGVICLWEMSISCQLEIFTNSRKSIKGGQRNNGWKRVKTKMSNIFSDSGAGLSGEEDGKTEVTEDTVTTRRSNLIFILSFLLWLWVRKYWTEHTFHRSCLWLISLDLDIWNTARPQVNTGQLHQEWNPDDKGGQGGRTSACDFTINHPKGESYVRYLETKRWTFSKEQNDTIDGVPTI